MMQGQKEAEARREAQDTAISLSLSLPRAVLHASPRLLPALMPFLQLPRPFAAVNATPARASGHGESLPWLQTGRAVWVSEQRRQADLPQSPPGATAGGTISVESATDAHSVHSVHATAGAGAVQSTNRGSPVAPLPARLPENPLALLAAVAPLLHGKVVPNPAAQGDRALRPPRPPAVHAAAFSGPFRSTSAAANAGSLVPARPAAATDGAMPFLLGGQMLGRGTSQPSPAPAPSLPSSQAIAVQRAILPAPPGAVAAETVQGAADGPAMPAAQYEERRLVWRAAPGSPLGQSGPMPVPQGRRHNDIPQHPGRMSADGVTPPAPPSLPYADGASLAHLALVQETVVHTVKQQVTREMEHQRRLVARQLAQSTQSRQPATGTADIEASVTSDAVVQQLLHKLRSLMQEERFRQGLIR